MDLASKENPPSQEALSGGLAQVLSLFIPPSLPKEPNSPGLGYEVLSLRPGATGQGSRSLGSSPAIFPHVVLCLLLGPPVGCLELTQHHTSRGDQCQSRLKGRTGSSHLPPSMGGACGSLASGLCANMLRSRVERRPPSRTWGGAWGWGVSFQPAWLFASLVLVPWGGEEQR